MESCETHFVENGEELQLGTYNGVTILYRTSDLYINVGKLCRDAREDFYNFRRGKKWKQIIEYWNQEYKIESTEKSRLPLIELKKGYPKAQGIYINPDLIHFVANWISIDYAFKVAKIMNLINEHNRILNKTLDETIIELQDKLDQAYDEINIKNKLLQEKNEQLKQSDNILEVKDKHIVEH